MDTQRVRQKCKAFLVSEAVNTAREGLEKELGNLLTLSQLSTALRRML